MLELIDLFSFSYASKCSTIHFTRVVIYSISFQVVDDNYQELCPGKIGKIVVRVKPYRPLGLFSRYVVS